MGMAGVGRIGVYVWGEWRQLYWNNNLKNYRTYFLTNWVYQILPVLDFIPWLWHALRIRPQAQLPAQCILINQEDCQAFCPHFKVPQSAVLQLLLKKYYQKEHPNFPLFSLISCFKKCFLIKYSVEIEEYI